MATLTEFLLERIAEDEAIAQSGFSHPDRWVRVAHPVKPDVGIPNGLSCTAVLAECEAKRNFLREVSGWRGTDSLRLCAERVERHMGVPYADHSDYNDDWRP